MRETHSHQKSQQCMRELHEKKSRYYVTFTDHLKLAPWQLRIRRCEHTKWKKENSEEVESWALQLERTADSHGVKVWSWKRWRSWVYTRPVSWARDQAVISCRDLVREILHKCESCDTKKTSSTKRTLLGLYKFTCCQFWFVCQQNVKSPSRCAAHIRQFSRIFELKLAV